MSWQLNKLKKSSLLFKILYMLLIVQSITFVVFLSVKKAPLLQALFIIVLTITQLIGYKMIHSNKNRLIYTILPLIEYGIILAIFIGNTTGIEAFVLVLFTIKVIMMYPIGYGLGISLFGYTGYILIWEWSTNNLYEILINGLSYSLLAICIVGLKLLLRQRETIIQLNKKILEQSSAMEKMAMIEERSRIAKDMHDTVGHTLTTAIVSLEGADVLMEKDVQEAHRRLKVAKEQLKSGLGDIRLVVKQLRNDTGPNFEMHLESRIEQIITDIQQKSSINIQLEYAIENTLVSLQNYVLYNVVKESITNAIKHSAARSIQIKLMESKDIVITAITNDGVTVRDMEEGFGLKTMRESVEAIGGKMTYGYKQADQFELMVYIPLIQEVNVD